MPFDPNDFVDTHQDDYDLLNIETGQTDTELEWLDSGVEELDFN